VQGRARKSLSQPQYHWGYEMLRTVRVVTYHSDVEEIGLMTRHAEESRTVMTLVHERRSTSRREPMTSTWSAHFDRLIPSVAKPKWQRWQWSS